MKTESDVKPQRDFEVENIVDGKCEVVFYDNIQEVKKDDGIKYSYDMYRLATNYVDNIAEKIGTNLSVWEQKAYENEYNKLASEIRKQRDELLNKTDWTQMADVNISVELKNKYIVYRQALRDITLQECFPYYVEFPTIE